MVQPENFVDEKYPHKVCKLKKALYGLKQSGREWNSKLDKVLKTVGFKQCNADTCVYVMNTGQEINIIAVYVDDILFVFSNIEAENQRSFRRGRQGTRRLFFGHGDKT